MKRFVHLKSALAGGVSAIALSTGAWAADFDIPAGDLKAALKAYAVQSGVALIASDVAVRGARSRGAKGELTAAIALSRILDGTGFAPYRTSSGAVVVARKARETQAPDATDAPMRVVAAASGTASGIESVVVTSSKIKGDIQTVPIAITALSQEQLTSRQIAGGPDLVKEVPNLTFSKTNFTGYNIQIRGIGTQAISVTTDPAVAVAFNDMPFIRNHFFEQEFYDVGQVEVLRGPQGTLYGRNATAGVVNVISAKPTDQFEAMASGDVGNYNNRRVEGMINIPIVDDRLDIRAAAEWTKRDGYSFNTLTSQPIDGRDLWSSRLSFGIKPFENLQVTLIWEHFQENDDRLRSSKQLCKHDPGLTEVGGMSTGSVGTAYLSQGCLPTSLYGADAFEVVNGFSLPYYGGLTGAGAFGALFLPLKYHIDPYASETQSRNLRVIESALNPSYRAKNDTIELNADYAFAPGLNFTSQTGFDHDFLWSTEDYNRFNTRPGIFTYDPADFGTEISPDGLFCDPQLGCSDRLVAQDLSTEHAWQLSQEFRLASNYTGPLNFSVGANYLHYETDEYYYVFFNTLTLLKANRTNYVSGISDNSDCLNGHFYTDPQSPGGPLDCSYIDPNPINSLNNNGHNYFLSQNPYVLNSYAGFGEAYYQVTPDVRLTGGLRWTDDEKHFVDIPSEVVVAGWGYPSTGVVDQKWHEWTGRFAANWTPKLDFTDQTMLYGSYAHGYKAGGANPPGAVLIRYSNATEQANPVHPLTFKPEFIDAFEVGTKNTLLDGTLTLNGDAFYYDYKAYQISYIVDRTSVNLNFDSTVKGAELETTWEPAPGLKFSFAGGYEDARLAKGSRAVDLMDRTAGNPDWLVVKPYVTQASNCVLPVYVVKYLFVEGGFQVPDACGNAWFAHHDPLTYRPYNGPPGSSSNGTPIPDYPGFNWMDYPQANGGTGFYKDLSNNQLPNAPHFTTSFTAEYTMPIFADWAATLHSDFYWQSQSMARVFNDRPYDKLRGYSNVNLALILTGANGWQVLGYLKNVFDTTAITGDFLNSDDTGLTTNVFLTDPRLYGIRVTKNF